MIIPRLRVEFHADQIVSGDIHSITDSVQVLLTADAVLRTQHEADQMRIQELEKALAALYANQNGCPLPKYEAEWSKAMADTERLLKFNIIKKVMIS